MKKKTTEDFINEARTVHGNRYDYSKSNYTGVFDKLTIICPVHGEFEQTPHNHLRGNGCSKCAHEELAKSKSEKAKSTFLERAYKKTGGKYDMSEADYVNAKTKIKAICHAKDSCGNEHGPFYITPSNLMSLYGCPICAKETTPIKFRIPFEQYQARVNEKYGKGVYTVDRNSYETNPHNITVHCNIHGTDFITTTRKFPRDSINRCKECIEDITLTIKSNKPETEKNETFEHPELNPNIKEKILSGEEVWVPVRGADNYIVSSSGQVKRINRLSREGNTLPDYQLKPTTGNRRITVAINGKSKTVHKIVFESFYEMDVPKGYEYTIDHLDTDFNNNSVLNLRLCRGIRDNMIHNPITMMHLRKVNKNKGKSLLFNIDKIEGEIWKPCVGYEGLYSVSNIGRVKAEARRLVERNTGVVRIKRPHLMKLFLKDDRSYTVGLSDSQGHHKNHFVHRLMYEAFIDKIPEGFEVDHLDSNPSNNVLSNLRACSHIDNVSNPNSKLKRTASKHARRTIIGFFDKKGNLLKTFGSQNECAIYFGVCTTTVQRAIYVNNDNRRFLKNGCKLAVIG